LLIHEIKHVCAMTYNVCFSIFGLATVQSYQTRSEAKLLVSRKHFTVIAFVYNLNKVKLYMSD